jgi:hypothetical protein
MARRSKIAGKYKTGFECHYKPETCKCESLVAKPRISFSVYTNYINRELLPKCTCVKLTFVINNFQTYILCLNNSILSFILATFLTLKK